MLKKQNKNKKAFISIFAIFFSAIVVSVLTALFVLFIKQIQILNTDYASFQAFYTSDSAFECGLYKESQISAPEDSVFLPANKDNLGYCADAGDLVWQTAPSSSGGPTNSTANFSLTTDQGNFCGQMFVTKQQPNTEVNHTMKLYGQSRNCSDTGSKVIEREIDFIY